MQPRPVSDYLMMFMGAMKKTLDELRAEESRIESLRQAILNENSIRSRVEEELEIVVSVLKNVTGLVFFPRHELDLSTGEFGSARVWYVFSNEPGLVHEICANSNNTEVRFLCASEFLSLRTWKPLEPFLEGLASNIGRYRNYQLLRPKETHET
jgi:hypothetical protein